jgi:hypothetical protein
MAADLQKKLQLKDGHKVALVHLPEDVKPLFGDLPCTLTELESNRLEDADFDVILFFVQLKSDLIEVLTVINHQQSEPIYWIAYPKKSGQLHSELDRDTMWPFFTEANYDPVRMISINENWSALRLVNAHSRKKASTFGQDPPGVDRSKKTVIPPEDLNIELERHPDAAQFFESLAFSYKRDYVGWIHSAKKEETRARRIKQTIELLTQHKKAK